MRPPIGYYVHHHGEGHRQRALALAACCPDRMVMLGTGLAGRTGRIQAIDLPDDRMADVQAFDGIDATVSRPNALHYAPLDHDGVRERMGTIARWIAQHRPALMVVDVSVEVAMLARLCATPVAFVRLSGRRDDTAHCEAYRASSLLITPFARQLDDPEVPDWVRNKTMYCPGIVTHHPHAADVAARSVLVVAGRGGAPLNGRLVAEAAAATPTYRWEVIGFADLPDCRPDNLTFAGWVDDAMARIAEAEIVIGAAGDGLVNAVIAMGKPFVCCPEPRPFDEQIRKAQGLRAAGAAVVIEEWPAATDWPSILADVTDLDRRQLAALGDPSGAVRTMTALEAFADRQK